MHTLSRQRLALANFLLPLLTVHACYLLAAGYGHVPWCFPYLDSCSSISAAGRSMPEYLVFKLGMIAAALAKIRFWQFAGSWLDYLGDGPSKIAAALPTLGLVAGLSLILYTSALGHEGDVSYLMRRFGVALYFGLTFICQCLLTLRLHHLRRNGVATIGDDWQRLITSMLVILLSVGIGMVFLDLVPDYKERLEDAMEWQMALLMTLVYGVFWQAWRRTGF